MSVNQKGSSSATLGPNVSTHTRLPQAGPLGLNHSPSVSKFKSAKPVRILVVDDHPIVRKGVSNCLAHHKHLIVVAEAKDGEEALAKAKEVLPDLVLMDIEMPRLDGLSASEILHKENPLVKIILLSGDNLVTYALRIAKSGVQGCVSKHASAAELVQAIEKVVAGGDIFDSEVANAALHRFVEGRRHPQISNREHEVLVAIAEGLQSKEIACRLAVSVRTVDTHRQAIMRKLNIHSVAGLTRFAIAEGLIHVLT